jgi:hypothetical protein
MKGTGTFSPDLCPADDPVEGYLFPKPQPGSEVFQVQSPPYYQFFDPQRSLIRDPPTMFKFERDLNNDRRRGYD